MIFSILIVVHSVCSSMLPYNKWMLVSLSGTVLTLLFLVYLILFLYMLLNYLSQTCYHTTTFYYIQGEFHFEAMDFPTCCMVDIIINPFGWNIIWHKCCHFSCVFGMHFHNALHISSPLVLPCGRQTIGVLFLRLRCINTHLV